MVAREGENIGGAVRGIMEELASGREKPLGCDAVVGAELDGIGREAVPEEVVAV